VSVWSWLKLTICLWLLRKAAKPPVAAAAHRGDRGWPLTGVALAGYTTAWWRAAPGLAAPPGRLVADPAARLAGGRGGCPAGGGRPRWPACGLEHGWHHPAALAAAARSAARSRRGPAGLGCAVVWWWRTYAITTGLGGYTASAPIIFDARQWRRQVRAAQRLTEAPGAVPLAAAGVGSGRRDHPGGRAPVGPGVRAAAAALAGTWSSSARRRGEDQLDDPAVGRLVHRRPRRRPGRPRGAPLLVVLDAKAAPMPAAKPTGPAACSTLRGPPGRDLAG